MTLYKMTNLGSGKRKHRLDLSKITEVTFVIRDIIWTLILRNSDNFITLILDFFQRR